MPCIFMSTQEGRLQYNVSSVAHDNWLNLARDMSATNFRGYDGIDSNGNLLVYVCDFEFLTDTAANSIHIRTAPETWKTKNACKKWHAYRELMFKESGIKRSERGTWSKSIRPYFDPLHAGSPQYTLTPQQVAMKLDGDASEWSWNDESNIALGDWTYTNIVVETNPDSPDTTKETDVFNLCLMGQSVNALTGTSSSDQHWDTVAMIESYNQDRAAMTDESYEPVSDTNNPLALLKGRSESAYETLEIAKEEGDDGPPYDVEGGIWPVLGGYLESTSTGQQITRAYGVRIPAGLALIEASATTEFRCIVRRIERA